MDGASMGGPTLVQKTIVSPQALSKLQRLNRATSLRPPPNRGRDHRDRDDDSSQERDRDQTHATTSTTPRPPQEKPQSRS